MRVLRFSELHKLKGIPFSRMHIDRLEKAGNFPRRFKIGVNSVCWSEKEIDEWLEQRAAERRTEI